MPATERPSPGTRIIVCRTCDRFAPALQAGQASRGAVLAAAMQQAVATRGNDFPVRLVNCLAGCKSPCNVVIDGGDKFRLRFSHLTPDDIAGLLEVAERHRASTDGKLGGTDLPASLRGRLTASAPARLVVPGGH